MKNLLIVMLCIVALLISREFQGFLGFALNVVAGWILGGVAWKAQQYDRIKKAVDDFADEALSEFLKKEETK